MEATEEANALSMSGWLIKKGGKRHNWKERFFVMHGSLLLYYESQEHTNATPLGVIPIAGCFAQMKHHAKYPFHFELTLSHSLRQANPQWQRTYCFRAASKKLAVAWIDALQGTPSEDSAAPPARGAAVPLPAPAVETKTATVIETKREGPDDSETSVTVTEPVSGTSDASELVEEATASSRAKILVEHARMTSTERKDGLEKWGYNGKQPVFRQWARTNSSDSEITARKAKPKSKTKAATKTKNKVPKRPRRNISTPSVSSARPLSLSSSGVKPKTAASGAGKRKKNIAPGRFDRTLLEKPGVMQRAHAFVSAQKAMRALRSEHSVVGAATNVPSKSRKEAAVSTMSPGTNPSSAASRRSGKTVTGYSVGDGSCVHDSDDIACNSSKNNTLSGIKARAHTGIVGQWCLAESRAFRKFPMQHLPPPTPAEMKAAQAAGMSYVATPAPDARPPDYVPWGATFGSPPPLPRSSAGISAAVDTRDDGPNPCPYYTGRQAWIGGEVHGDLFYHAANPTPNMIGPGTYEAPTCFVAESFNVKEPLSPTNRTRGVSPPIVLSAVGGACTDDAKDQAADDVLSNEARDDGKDGTIESTLLPTLTISLAIDAVNDGRDANAEYRIGAIGADGPHADSTTGPLSQTVPEHELTAAERHIIGLQRRREIEELARARRIAVKQAAHASVEADGMDGTGASQEQDLEEPCSPACSPVHGKPIDLTDASVTSIGEVVNRETEHASWFDAALQGWLDARNSSAAEDTRDDTNETSNISDSLSPEFVETVKLGNTAPGKVACKPRRSMRSDRCVLVVSPATGADEDVEDSSPEENIEDAYFSYSDSSSDAYLDDSDMAEDYDLDVSDADEAEDGVEGPITKACDQDTAASAGASPVAQPPLFPGAASTYAGRAVQKRRASRVLGDVGGGGLHKDSESADKSAAASRRPVAASTSAGQRTADTVHAQDTAHKAQGNHRQTGQQRVLRHRMSLEAVAASDNTTEGGIRVGGSGYQNRSMLMAEIRRRTQQGSAAYTQDGRRTHRQKGAAPQ